MKQTIIEIAPAIFFILLFITAWAITDTIILNEENKEFKKQNNGYN